MDWLLLLLFLFSTTDHRNLAFQKIDVQFYVCVCQRLGFALSLYIICLCLFLLSVQHLISVSNWTGQVLEDVFSYLQRAFKVEIKTFLLIIKKKKREKSNDLKNYFHYIIFQSKNSKSGSLSISLSVTDRVNYQSFINASARFIAHTVQLNYLLISFEPH